MLLTASLRSSCFATAMICPTLSGNATFPIDFADTSLSLHPSYRRNLLRSALDYSAGDGSVAILSMPANNAGSDAPWPTAQ
jgi:hypothetical protein